MAAPRFRLSEIDSDVAVCNYKVCGAPAGPDGYADFSKNCVAPTTTGEQANLLPIPYMRCSQFGRLFTTALDHPSDGLHIALHRPPSWLLAQPLDWHANSQIPLEPIGSSGEPA